MLEVDFYEKFVENSDIIQVIGRCLYIFIDEKKQLEVQILSLFN